MTIKFIISAAVGLALSLTSKRFDKSWRQSDRGFKYFCYEYVFSTVAANYIADDPVRQIKHWRQYI